MEKKNNGIVILLVILVIGLSGYILYDKDILGLKGEKGESNTSINDSSKKDEKIEIGSVGNKESKIKLEIDDNLYFYIKDGKVVFHKQDGTEIVDSTIPDKVIQIAKGFSCDGGDARLIALTDKGEVYYNKYVKLESVSKNDYNYKFDFIKVIAEEKVYGIDSIQPNIIYTCSYKEFFAYVSKDDMKIINPYIDNDIYLKNLSERKVISASLGKTYNELYPYKDYITPNLDMPFLYETKEGKLYFEKTSVNPIANENMYLTIDSNYIYSDEIYIRETNNQNEYKYYIIDKNKKIYIMTVSPTNNNNYYKYTYTIKNTGKILKNIKEEKQEGKKNKITLEYTDGTSEEI